MEASERLYRACVMLWVAECRECSTSSGLAEALVPTCLHNTNRAKVYFDEGIWSKGGLHALAQLAVGVRLQSLNGTNTKAGKHIIVCTRFGLYTYRADNVHCTMNCVVLCVVTGVLLLCISFCFTFEAQAKLCMEALRAKRYVHDRSPKTYSGCRAQDGVTNRISTASAADTQDSQNIGHLNVAACPPKDETGCMLSSRPTVRGLVRQLVTG